MTWLERKLQFRVNQYNSIKELYYNLREKTIHPKNGVTSIHINQMLK